MSGPASSIGDRNLHGAPTTAQVRFESLSKVRVTRVLDTQFGSLAFASEMGTPGKVVNAIAVCLSRCGDVITNSFVAEGKINDYDTYRNKIERFSKDLFDNSPEPRPVINALLKLIEDKNPTFSNPVGKGASVILSIQHFAYKTFENTIIKNINKFK